MKNGSGQLLFTPHCDHEHINILNLDDADKSLIEKLKVFSSLHCS